MKYYNLVFVKHPNSLRSFMFQAPLNYEAKINQEVLCATRYGDKVGTIVSESIMAPESMAKIILENTGGYFPPAKIKAEIKTIQSTETVFFDEEMPF